jgi:uncharacterized protein YebE (UPF0316 family)
MEQADLEKQLRRLKYGVLRVTFNKVSGEQRVMDCTLQKHMCRQLTKKNHCHKKRFAN